MSYMDTTLSLTIEYLGDSSPYIVEIYYDISNSYHGKGDLNKRWEYLEKSLEWCIRIFGRDHLKVAITYVRMGDFYVDRNFQDKALEYFYKALNMREKLLGEEDLIVIQTYKDLAIHYNNAGNFSKQRIYLNKALRIQRNTLGDTHLQTGYTYNDLGVYYMDIARYDSAIIYFEKAKQIYKHAKRWRGYGTIWFVIGECYAHLSRLAKALEHFEIALSIGLEHFDTNSYVVSESYNNIAYYHQIRGDYDKALIYHNEALDIRLKVWEKDQYTADRMSTRRTLGNSYNNIGSCYEAKGDYDKALEYHRKSYAIWYKKKYNTSYNYEHMGKCHLKKGAVDSALYYYKKALLIRIKKHKEQHPFVASNYNSIGHCYKRKDDHVNALKYYEKALRIRLNVLGSKHTSVATSYDDLGVYYAGYEDWNKALYYFQNALIALVPDFNNDNVYSNPSLKNTYSKIYLLKILANKATALERFYKEEGKKIENLKFSFQTWQLAVNLIDTIRRSYSKGAKQDLMNRYFKVYEGATRVANQLYKEEGNTLHQYQAFRFTEKSKAVLLAEALQESEALRFADIPDSLLKKERALKIDLSHCDAQLQKRKLQKEDYYTNLIQELENRFFNLNREYETLVKHFEKEYPDYYRLKYDLTVASVQDVQQELLGDQSALVEYLLGDSSLFIFAITANDYKVLELPKDSLEKQLQKIQSFLTDRSHHNAEAYHKCAWQLYKKIFEPVQNWLNSTEQSYQKLIIIPDGALAQIPFEALLTEAPRSSKEAAYPPSYKNLPYLLQEYQISYGYSATLLIRDKNKTPGKTLGKYVAFAFSDKHTLEQNKNKKELSETERELKTIDTCFNGKSYLGYQASESNFKSETAGYRMIHLAMHGKADTTEGYNPHIVFRTENDTAEDGKLYLHELYNMKLNARLVTLSTCVTGSGKLEKGEGLMSLSRAFAYARVPSVVTALWNVDDDAAPKLMNYFYKGLSKGLSKDAALRDAKLRYMEGVEHPYRATPYYWADFVLIGDPEAIKMDKKHSCCPSAMASASSKL